MYNVKKEDKCREKTFDHEYGGVKYIFMHVFFHSVLVDTFQ